MVTNTKMLPRATESGLNVLAEWAWRGNLVTSFAKHGEDLTETPVTDDPRGTWIPDTSTQADKARVQAEQERRHVLKARAEMERGSRGEDATAPA